MKKGRPSKKRKAEDEGSSETKQSTEDGIPDQCGIQAVGNAMDNGKSASGGSSEQPGTSNDKVREEDSKESNDQQDAKKILLQGSKVSGELLFSGGANWDLTGRKDLPKNVKKAAGENLWGPHRLKSLQGIKVTSAFSGCCAAHTVIIIEGGQAFTWGRNEKGQLGHGDIKRRDIPTLVETLKDDTIVSAACGRGHTLFLTEGGIVYASGDNKNGQLGIGSNNKATFNIPKQVKFEASTITKVGCGAEFSLIVDVAGNLYSFGSAEYGQLGHNTDGSYLAKGNKLLFDSETMPRRITAFIQKARDGHILRVEDVHIVDVACGTNHSVVLDSDKRCFSFGFGGYGRLGHSETKDEMVPRLIVAFSGQKGVRGVKKVFAGGSYSMAINVHDILYFFGQTNTNGEASIYPKPVQDLLGWKVQDVGCSNRSIVCAADDSVISWGPSPTYGELGYGESGTKSSTRPKKVTALDGIHIHSIACGYGHTIFIAQNDTEEDRNKINQLPEYEP